MFWLTLLGPWGELILAGVLPADSTTAIQDGIVIRSRVDPMDWRGNAASSRELERQVCQSFERKAGERCTVANLMGHTASEFPGRVTR